MIMAKGKTGVGSSMPLLGKNTPSAKELLKVVERLERLAADKKAIGEDEKAVLAEAKKKGLHGPTIRALVGLRKKSTSDVADAENLLDSYRNALGMLPDPPLFQYLRNLARDALGREALVDALKDLVPEGGEIVVKSAGASPIRLVRDKDGPARPAPAARTRAIGGERGIRP